MRNVGKWVGVILAAATPSASWGLEQGAVNKTRLEYTSATLWDFTASLRVRGMDKTKLGGVYLLLGCEDQNTIPELVTSNYTAVTKTLVGENHISGVFEAILPDEGYTITNSEFKSGDKYVSAPLQATYTVNSNERLYLTFRNYGTRVTCKKPGVWIGWDSKPANIEIELSNGTSFTGGGVTGVYYRRYISGNSLSQYSVYEYLDYVTLNAGEKSWLFSQKDAYLKTMINIDVSPNIANHITLTDGDGNQVRDSYIMSERSARNLYVTNVMTSKGTLSGTVRITIQAT